MEIVAASPVRISPRYLERTISETYGLEKTRARQMLKDLIGQGELEYTYEFGSTYLVRSFSKPVRISTHVVMLFKLSPGQLSAAAGIRRHGCRSKPSNMFSRS
jgi:hypothetical protein